MYDYYRLFEIRENFSTEDLKKAYKKQSLKYHPDINPNGKEMFLLISEAYQVLTDSSKRREYENLRNKILSGDFSTSDSYEYTDQRQDQPYSYSSYASQQYTDEEFEDFFRQFHGFRRSDEGADLTKMADISGRLGAILGGIISFIIGGGFRSVFTLIPGIFLGYIIGRSNPSLGPLLIGITNVAVGIAAVLGSGIFLLSGSWPLIIVLWWGALFYFRTSRRWSREFYQNEARPRQ